MRDSRDYIVRKDLIKVLLECFASVQCNSNGLGCFHMQAYHRKSGCVLGNHCYLGRRERHILSYGEGILLPFSEGPSLKKQ